MKNINFVKAAALLIVSVVFSWSASAEDLRWSADQTAATDGSGTWNNATQFWSNGSGVLKNYTTSDQLLFGRGNTPSSGTITIDGGGNLLTNSVGRLSFNRDYTILAAAASDGLDLVNGIEFYQQTGINVNISARLGGSAGGKNWNITQDSTLNVSGSGVLGGTIIGSVSGNGLALVNAGTAIISGGAWNTTFQVTMGARNANTVVKLTGGSLNTGGQQLTVGTGANSRTEFVVDGGIVSAGRLNMAGSNDNDAIGTGILTIVSGSVYVTDVYLGNDYGQGTVNVQGGYFTVGSGNTIISRYANNYNAVNSALNVSGGVAVTQGINLGDSRAWNLEGNSASVNLSGGILYAKDISYNFSQNGGTAPTLGSGRLTFNGGTLAANGRDISIIANANGAVDVQVNGVGTILARDVDGSSNRTININTSISGAGTLVKIGNGGLVLNGYAGYTHTFSGTLDVRDGALNINSEFANLSTLRAAGGITTLNFSAALAPASKANIINSAAALELAGGWLDLTGVAAGASQAFANTAVSGVSVVNANNNGGALTLDFGALTRTKGGALTLDFGAITRTKGGALTLNTSGAGATQFKSSGADGIVRDANGIAYIFTGTGKESTFVERNAAGELVAFNNYTQATSSVWDAAWNETTFLNIDRANYTGALNAANGGTLGGVRFSYDDTTGYNNINIQTFTTLKIGTVLGAIGVNNSWGNPGIINGGGSLTALDGASEILFINNSPGFITITANIVDNGAPVSIVVGGNSTVNFDRGGLYSYTGDTIIGPGTIFRVGNANSGNANSEYVVFDNATLNINNQNNTTIGALSGYGSVTIGNGVMNVGGKNTSTVFNGEISSGATGKLVKTGAGSLTLNGISNNLYNVEVSTGTLLVNGQINRAEAVVSVASDAILGGNGTVRNITVNDGGILSPGDGGLGTLTVSKDLVLLGDTSFVFDLGYNSTLADKLVIGGALTGSASAAYNFDFSGGEEGVTYTLLTFNSLSGIDLSQFASSSGLGDFALTNNALTFTLTQQIPEPSTWALLLTGAALLAACRMKRRHS